MEDTVKIPSFFIPFDLRPIEKSVDKNGYISATVYGDISDSYQDLQGEVLPQDRLDFSLLEKRGRIKYEHKKGDPGVHIGVPHGVVSFKDKSFMVGKIFAKQGTAQGKLAEDFLSDYDNTRAWNELHPDNPRNPGFSIEALALKDKKTGQLLKAVVTDVVITNQPVNKRAWCEVVKAFSAGHGVNPSEMTGSQAGRIEHLEPYYKIITGASKMKFSDKTECKKWFIEKGLPEDIAEEKASEWEQLFQKRTTRTENLNKSIEAIEDFAKDLKTESDKLENSEVFEQMEKSFSTYIQPAQDSATTDPVPFLRAIAENDVKFKKDSNAQMALVLKGITGIAERQKEVMEINKSLLEEIDLLSDYNRELVNFNDKIEKSLQAIDAGVSTDGLDKEPIAEAKTEDNKPTEPTRTFVYSFLEKGLYGTETSDEEKSEYSKSLGQYDIGGKNIHMIDNPSIKQRLLSEWQKENAATTSN